MHAVPWGLMSYDPYSSSQAAWPPPGWPPPAVPPAPKPGIPTWGAIALGLSIGLTVGVGLGVGGVLLVQNLDVSQSTEDALDKELPRLLDFVESERGLGFLEDVDVEELDDEAFIAALQSGGEKADPDAPPADYAATFAALQLTRSADDYYDAEMSGLSGAVTGFYDSDTDRLVVRGTDWTPLVETTVVHELTHALQDQHFDLSSLEDAAGADAEAQAALTGIIEGDATRVEDAFIAEQSSAWSEDLYDSYDAEFELGSEASYDPLVDALNYMPYDLGGLAVSTLYGLGGNEAIDAALTDPPTTTEQLDDIESWYDDEPSAAAAAAFGLPAPPDGVEIVDQGALGVFGLSLLQGIEDEFYYVEETIGGWRGDSYVTWIEPGARKQRPCTKAIVVFDDAASADDALELFEDWLDEDETEATRLSDTALELASCGRAV